MIRCMLSEHPHSRRRWLRFRLSTVLLLVTIAALGVAQYAAMLRTAETQATNQRLSAENAKLRAEAGYLQVDDPNKAAVLRVRNLDELTWQWKVWLPKGKWKLCELTQGIPSQGVPGGSSSVGPKDGGREVSVTVTVRKSPDGKWRTRAELDKSQVGTVLVESHRLIEPMTNPKLANGLSSQSINIAGDKSQESFDPNSPVVLIRLRAHDIAQTSSGNWQSKMDPNNSEGIMVWFERMP